MLHGPTVVRSGPSTRCRGGRPLLTKFPPRLPPLGLWSTHEERVSTVSVGAEHPYNGSGRPGVRGRDVSGGLPSIPRFWGRLTPCAPCPSNSNSLLLDSRVVECENVLY